MKDRQQEGKRRELQSEFDRYVEGKMTQEEVDDLEKRLEKDEEARAWFAEYLHLHALLQQDGEELLAEAGGTVIDFPAPSIRLAAVRYAAVVALLLGCVWLLRGNFLEQKDSGESDASIASSSLDSAQKAQGNASPVNDVKADTGPDKADNEIVNKVAKATKTASKAPDTSDAPSVTATVATLADTRECKWAGSSLPTASGARLGTGRLHLLEGLATVVFDGGAQVTMEAPAVMEVVSAEKCRLISGGLVGWVRKGAEGFQVETNDAMVTDYGTRFGVTVGKSGRSEVVVLEGEVGVAHSKVEGEKRLEMGEALRYDAKAFLTADSLGDLNAEPNRNEELGDKKRERGWKAISTATGKGKDSYVRMGNSGAPFGRAPLVMAKNSPDRATNQRKTYLGFDLSRLNGAEIHAAELVLEIRSSGLGYASVVPDCQFTVYGLTDESLDEWEENSMVWENAPANQLDHGSRLDADKVVKLGSFEIKQGVSSGFRTVEGEALKQFLNQDSNGLSTLILVRNTEQSAGNGLVHAFASSEHPTAMAPTLRVKMVK